MDNSFISDKEIDKILGRISEYRPMPDLNAPVDRFNVSAEDKARFRAEYIRRKSQEYIMDPVQDRSVKNMHVLTNAFTPASLIRKSYAFCTDLCVVGVMLAGTVLGVSHVVGIDTFMKAPTTWIAALYAALFIIYVLYFDGLMGQTPGKFLLNIKIVNSSNNERISFFRSMVRMLLFFIPPLGFLGIHDLVTKTRLVNLG